MASTEQSVSAMIESYREIIGSFVSGSTSASEFEAAYLRHFKDDRTQVSGSEYDTLERLFFDVDDYVEDPGLRDGPKDIGPDELRARARRAFDVLYS
ncbi:hypothetical protein GCM10007304_11130 [Rhodococcoides trifolii]|uniref:Colicin D immunity protein domain-containing protein n=1 Tax=Rhodococcoides trifolii TaxID=908250 RepID=A0A917CXK4_9NOCA|nr:colicin immunity domain-containing protein [Rhodococcus trifolii]GGF98993.1 hypothetical protein GCM10007304_11130 [Rhodococcus trifolii]